MKNLWMQFFYGYTKIKIEGMYLERFLNRCIENDIHIWEIQRLSPDKIVCYISLSDVKKIRPLLKMTGCKVRFVERIGLPFWLRKMRLRLGFSFGIAAFFIIIVMLSNVVWNIEIEGASPKVEHELRQALHELGIKKGKFIFLLPSVEDIQQLVLEKIDEATWIGVKLTGTTYRFEVVEQTVQEIKKPLAPRHLVAKKKAVIYDLFVEKGVPLVKPNDFVNVGDMLVSGLIGREGETIPVPAKGQVFGEIWYKSTVSIPIETIFSTLTGQRKKTHYLSVMQFDIPIWGFGKHTFEKYVQTEKQYPLQLLNWTLPVQYKQVEWLEKQDVAREYSKKDAVQIAKEMARNELRKKIPKDAKIIGEKILHESVDNGKVKLNIHYRVIEDIAVEQPIIQGD